MRLAAAPWIAALLLAACFEYAGKQSSSGSGSGSETDTGSTGGGSAGTTGSGTGSGTATSSGSSGTSGSSGGGTAGTTGATCGAGDTCVEIPGGWSGPVVVVIGAGGDPPPACPPDFPNAEAMAYSGLVAPFAACETCSCGEAQDVVCVPPGLMTYGNSNCNGSPDGMQTLGAAETCTNFPNPSGSYGVESGAVTVAPGTGTCPASGGTATIIPPTWDSRMVACAGDPMPCGDAGACVPQAPGSLCIWRDGDVPCPPGTFTTSAIWWQDFADERGCTPCECGAPGGATCDTTIELFYDVNCQSAYTEIQTPGIECTTLYGTAPESARFHVEDIVGGSCAASGGEPVGQANPSAPMTVCCEPGP
jgi:hypothetical protein